ncbi:MAG: hypothetical protein HZA59_01390 [Hydrogenophilales bacterium]|nr:hypothetical protein [Hydrogenophilales bacterium]
MQQANQTQSIAIFIQEGGEEEVVKLTLEGFKDVVLCLTVQQARAIASHLIQCAHRIEVKYSLKKAKIKATQSAVERTGMPPITLALQKA